MIKISFIDAQFSESLCFAFYRNFCRLTHATEKRKWSAHITEATINNLAVITNTRLRFKTQENHNCYDFLLVILFKMWLFKRYFKRYKQKRGTAWGAVTCTALVFIYSSSLIEKGANLLISYIYFCSLPHAKLSHCTSHTDAVHSPKHLDLNPGVLFN